MAGSISRDEPALSGPARGREGSRLRRGLWVIAAALVPLAAALPEARAEDDDPYRALFFRGVDLMTAGRYGVGCPMLAESYRQRPLPGTLFALADCEDRWGKTARALAHYEEYLHRFELMTPEQRSGQRGRDKLAAARKAALELEVPMLSIRVISPAAPGAVIKLDGRPLVGASLAAPIRVDPGSHEIHAQAPGGPASVQSVQIEVGESRTVTVAVESARALARTERNPEPTALGRDGPSTLVLALGGTVGVASIGAGIGLTIASRAKYAEADRIAATLNDPDKSYCARQGNVSSERCVRLKDNNRTGDDLQEFGMVGFVAGGAALAGTVLYYVLAPSKEERRIGAQVRPVIAASQAGLEVSGNF